MKHSLRTDLNNEIFHYLTIFLMKKEHYNLSNDLSLLLLGANIPLGGMLSVWNLGNAFEIKQPSHFS